MYKWDERISQGIDSFYLNYFEYDRLGVLTVAPESNTLHYYSVKHKDKGHIALLSGTEMTIEDNVGGEYKLTMYYYYQVIQQAIIDIGNLTHAEFVKKYEGTVVALRKLQTKKQLNKALLEYQEVLNKLEQFTYCVAVTGCDDGHYMFYFKSKEIAMKMLSLCQSLEELISISKCVTLIETELNLEDIIEDIILLDERN